MEPKKYVGYCMTDRAYDINRTLENKIAIAENNNQNTILVTLDVLKEILALLKEQKSEIRQLRLALDIAKGTCNGIKMESW